MMKVGVLTWFKAINHGAVLQTYASCQMLRQLGCEPVVLDFDWEIEDDKKENRWNKIKRRVSSATPMKLFWYFQVKKNFKKKVLLFNDFISQELPVGKKYYEEKGLDAVYIGSDMVFDITEGYNPYMFGINVPSDYIFSYAASFGYTTYDKLIASVHNNEIISGLSKMKAIGYRDKNTIDICDKIDNKLPKCENIDPVLLYGFREELKKWDSKKWKHKSYLLIYAYDSTMNDSETIRQIKQIAKEEGLQIISCGYYHRWCDNCEPASPKEFLEMFKYAKYIITDTFHGTVFSLILHKNFASIIRKNGFKVKHLLDSVQLNNRIVEGKIREVLNCVPDYDYYDFWIEGERKKSLEYIKNNLCAAKEKSV